MRRALLFATAIALLGGLAGCAALTSGSDRKVYEVYKGDLRLIHREWDGCMHGSWGPDGGDSPDQRVSPYRDF